MVVSSDCGSHLTKILQQERVKIMIRVKGVNRAPASAGDFADEDEPEVRKEKPAKELSGITALILWTILQAAMHR